jgi:predicted AlkP superfamily phosphohydrolase/phosphomutase
MTDQVPVLAIGIDAAEATLVEKLCAAGKLPAIDALIRRGCYGRLDTNAALFAGGVWPTFLTSSDVPWQGMYHYKMWRHERMRCEVASDEWLRQRTFWESIGASHRVAIVDAPMTIKPPNVANGLQLSGWGTHDMIVKGSDPAALWGQLEKEFGRATMPAELFGPQTAGTLLRLRDDLLRQTEQISKLAESLFSREEWDLFFIVLGATHRGGHYLWDLSQIDSSALKAGQRETLEGALEEIYRACDSAVGRLVERLPDGGRVMVFALHGMGPNLGWSDLCTDILDRIQGKVGEGGRGAPKTGLLYGIKRKLPWQLVRQVTTRLPQGVQDRLVSLWSSGMYDWKETRYFPLPMDLAGYFRVNLKGREPDGIVEPGSEYDAVCAELEEALRSFHDVGTGQPIVDEVYRQDDLAPPGSPYRDLLPDLVVTWGQVSAVQSRAIRSDRYGELRLDPDGKLPSGRAGNHTNRGWIVMAGEGIEQGAALGANHIVDVAPTLMDWLGVEPPATFQGRPIQVGHGDKVTFDTR